MSCLKNKVNLNLEFCRTAQVFQFKVASSKKRQFHSKDMQSDITRADR